MTAPVSGSVTRAIAAIDELNAQDPNTIVRDGSGQPKELAHAQLMTARLLSLDPSPTDAQLLAARAHHLQRWLLPRGDYPEGRAGYLRWRTAARTRHADDFGELARACGVPERTIERAEQIIRKEGLGKDASVDTHEDCLCLVFFELQSEALAGDLADRTPAVVRKTLAKMTDRGVEALLGQVPLAPAVRELVVDLLDRRP